MNKSVKIFTALCISAVIFSSCKKKEEVHGNVAEQENNNKELATMIMFETTVLSVITLPIAIEVINRLFL